MFLEKRPQRAVGALAELRRRGLPAVLVVAGDGPQRRALQARARGLPVRFLRHVSDRGQLARLLATADVVIAPGPVETFGLSALEALASGTPAVVSRHSALPGIVGAAGLAAEDDDAACADAVQHLLERDVAGRRLLARQQAERFGWPAGCAASCMRTGCPRGVRSPGRPWPARGPGPGAGMVSRGDHRTGGGPPSGEGSGGALRGPG